MGSQMDNEETELSCQVDKSLFWSEHFLSKFGLEYIKHDILINEHKYKRKLTIIERKTKAVNTIARKFHLEANEKNVTKIFIKFRRALVFLMRRLIRRCLNQRWPFNFALLFAPPWLRAVEMKVKLMSCAFELERNKPATAELSQVVDFKLHLVESARDAVKSGCSLYGIEAVVSVIRRYNVALNEALKIWTGVCNNTKRLIALEAECHEGLHEVDWRVADLVLLYDTSFNIVTPASLSQPRQIQKLTYLFKAVVKKNVENELRYNGPNLLLAWMRVFALYPFSYGFTSLVFIQRQWYELKYLARCQVLAYHLGRSTSAPHPLLLSIVANFRHIVQEPFPKWSDLVNLELVVDLRNINQKIYKKVLKESVDVIKRASASGDITDNSTNESKEKQDVNVTESLNDNHDETSHSKTSEPPVDGELVDNINSKTLRLNSQNNTKDEKCEGLRIFKEEEDSICKMLSKSYLIIDSNTISGNDDPKNEAKNQTLNKIDECGIKTIKDSLQIDTRINSSIVTSNKIQSENTLRCNKEDNIDLIAQKESDKTDLNEALNVIDPTKAKKSLIFDSDSEDSASNNAVLSKGDGNSNKQNDVSTETALSTILIKNNVNNELEVINSLGNSGKLPIEHRDEIPLRKLTNGANTNKKLNTLSDPKLRKKPIIPLVRCDQTPTWKKYFTNETINIRKISRNQLCPFKIEHYESMNVPKQNTLLRQYRTYSCDSFYSNSNLNLNLDGLPENFLRNRKNKRLFRLCRPVSVKLERMRLTCVDKSIVCRRAKKIQLPDIDEVRKINSTILTAEVAPVSTTRCAPACEDMNEIYSEGNPMREIANLNIDNTELDALLKNLGAQLPNPVDLEKPMDPIDGLTSTYIGPPQESTHTGPMCEREHWNMELEQDGQESEKSNYTDQKCRDEELKLIDQILKIVRNCPMTKITVDTHGEESHGNIPNTGDGDIGDASDSNDNLKLSTVVDDKKEKRKILDKKRKNEQETNLAASQSQTNNKKKKKRERKVSEHSDACSDEYDEWSRQKNKTRKYFQLPNICARPRSQANIQNYNPYAPGTYGTVGTNVVLVADNQYNPNVTTVQVNNNKPYNNASQQTVSLLSENNSCAAVIDLTDAADDQVHEIEGSNQNSENNFTPIITNVYSLAQTQTVDEQHVAEDTDNINNGTRDQQTSQVIQPLLVPEMSINIYNAANPVANSAEVPAVPNVPLGADILPNTVPQVNSTIVQGTVLSQQTLGADAGGVQLQPTLFVQPSAAQAQYTSEGVIPPLVSIAADSTSSGRRFVIIPKSQLVNGNKSLLLPNMRIVNASITYNPVDHIQKMMVSNTAQVAPAPSLPTVEKEVEPATQMSVPTALSTWLEGKSDQELIILQVDFGKPSWTLKEGNFVVTPIDYTCEIPIYCGLGPSKVMTRIFFPREKNGVDIYNPPTVQIDDNAASGDSPFAKWVKSVLQNDGINNNVHKNANDSNISTGVESVEPLKDPVGLNAKELELDGSRKNKREKDENAKPTARIKVKSFARLTEDKESNFVGPSRVSLQGKLYMKVSDQPLKYAKVITAVPSFEEFHRLVSTDAPLWILPEGATSLDSLQPINTNFPVVIPIMANNTP